LEVLEVSLVDAAANKKRFYLKKRRTSMKFLDTIKKFLGGDLSKEQIKKVGELPEDTAVEIVSALEVLKRNRDAWPDEFEDAVKALVKFSTTDYPLVESDDEGEMNLEKTGARLSKLTKEQLTGLRDIVAKLITEAGALKKATAILDELLKDPAAADEVKKYAEGLTAEVFIQKMKRLEELEAKAKEPALKKSDVEELIKAAIAKAVPAKKAVKKSLDADEGDEGDEGDEPIAKFADPKYEKEVKKAGGRLLWPSIVGKVVKED
jgi:hypothetical protein